MSAAPVLGLTLPDAEEGGLPPSSAADLDSPEGPALAVIVTPPLAPGGKNVLVQGPPGAPVEPMGRELRALLRGKQAAVQEDGDSAAIITMEDEDPVPTATKVMDYISAEQARSLLLESRADLADVISHYRQAMAAMTADFQKERDELETRWRSIVASIVASSSDRAENLQAKAAEATAALRELQASTSSRIHTLEQELSSTFAKHDALVAASAQEAQAHQSAVAALEARHSDAVKSARDVAASASVVSQWRLTMQRRALLTHVADRDAALEDLETDRRRLTRAVVELHVARDALASQLEQAEVLNAQLRQASEEAAKQLAEMQAAITTAQGSATAEMAAAESEITSLRVQVSSLQAALQEAGSAAAAGASAAGHASLMARVAELEVALASAKASTATASSAAVASVAAVAPATSQSGADAAALYSTLIGGGAAEAAAAPSASGEATPAALVAIQARATAAEARVAALTEEVTALKARLAELAAAEGDGAGEAPLGVPAGDEGKEGSDSSSDSGGEEQQHSGSDGSDGEEHEGDDGEGAPAAAAGAGAGAGEAASGERAARGAGSLASSGRAPAGAAAGAATVAASGGGGAAGARDAAKVKEQDKVIKELRTKIRTLEAAAAKAAGAKAAGGGVDEKAVQQALEKQKAALEKKWKKEREDLEKEHKKEAEALTRRLTKAQGELTQAQADLEAVTKERDDLRRRLQLLGDIEKEMEGMRVQVEDGKKARAELETANARVVELDKLYKDEQTLRKKYWNMMEDMKGKIRVYCRARPMSNSELDRGNYSVVAIPDPMTIELDLGAKGRKQFVYDAVFGADSTQDQIAADTENLIQSAFDGFNVSIFAYGQTGSGKTFTMVGSKEHPGVTPRAVTRLYQLIEKAQSVCDVTVQCYMVELYLDNLIDLFWRVENPRGEPPKLEIKKDEKGLVVIRGAVMRDCPTAAATMEAFEAGNAVRHVGSTAMNATSSRSHLIFALLINTYNRQTKKTTTGKLSLIDLAGSERASKTGATSERLKEAQAINKSLSALGNVISALSSGDKSFIPYRDNKLTQLMSDSLGGNAKTLMFVNLSPADYNADETQTSLVYASRVKLITNSAEKMQESAEVARLKKIIAQLRAGNTAAADATQALEDEAAEGEGSGGPEVDDEGRPIGGDGAPLDEGAAGGGDGGAGADE